MRTREPLPAARKPAGGFRFLAVMELMVAWWAYRSGAIRLADLRTWFACHELVARRCGPRPGTPRYNVPELAKLTGQGPKRTRESLRRLEAAGLLTFSEDEICFETTGTFAGFWASFEAIPNNRRKVPVPRRILRLIAGGGGGTPPRPALIATILGHMLACLFYREGRCVGRGRVKVSWIAETFGICPRRIKEARAELVAVGWLLPLEADQGALNRWGMHVGINLAWGPSPATRSPAAPRAVTAGEASHIEADATAISTPPATIPVGPEPPPKNEDILAAPPGQELAPPRPAPAPELAPPYNDEKPLAGAKNQKPACCGPAVFSGFSFSPGGKGSAEEGRIPPRKPAIPPPPDFRDVRPEDLRDTGRLLALWAQAVALGLLTGSDRDRLRFFAAAEHAQATATRNAPGLFVHLVRGGLWHFATQADEDRAQARLKRHLFGAKGAKPPAASAGTWGASPAAAAAPALSADARLVRSLLADLARAGFRGDAFLLLRRERPEWTRERWDRAAAELAAGGPTAVPRSTPPPLPRTPAAIGDILGTFAAGFMA